MFAAQALKIFAVMVHTSTASQTPASDTTLRRGLGWVRRYLRIDWFQVYLPLTTVSFLVSQFSAMQYEDLW